MSKIENTAYSINPAELATRLGSDLKAGLVQTEIATRLQKWGLIIIDQHISRIPWLILLNQFKSPITYMLFVVAGLSFMWQEWLDGIAILVVYCPLGKLHFFPLFFCLI